MLPFARNGCLFIIPAIKSELWLTVIDFCSTVAEPVVSGKAELWIDACLSCFKAAKWLQITSWQVLLLLLIGKPVSNCWCGCSYRCLPNGLSTFPSHPQPPLSILHHTVIQEGLGWEDHKTHPVPARAVVWLPPTSLGCPVPHPTQPSALDQGWDNFGNLFQCHTTFWIMNFF